MFLTVKWVVIMITVTFTANRSVLTVINVKVVRILIYFESILQMLNEFYHLQFEKFVFIIWQLLKYLLLQFKLCQFYNLIFFRSISPIFRKHLEKILNFKSWKPSLNQFIQLWWNIIIYYCIISFNYQSKILFWHLLQLSVSRIALLVWQQLQLSNLQNITIYSLNRSSKILFDFSPLPKVEHVKYDSFKINR